jgi:uncharacterized cupin superfamily protein
MSQEKFPSAITASNVNPRTTSLYPEPFSSRMQGREKHILGDVFGLTNFGVNQTKLVAGAYSALRHSHSKQDEFIYILSGEATLISDDGETKLTAGMCVGFKAGNGNAHHIVNRSIEDVIYLEVGNRSDGDVVTYPEDDIQALSVDGKWQFTHKEGTPY